MKRFTVISIIFLVLSSFTHFAKKESIEELVLFGYHSFCKKDSTNWVYDSTRLDIRQYFEYKKNRFIKIAVGRSTGLLEYHNLVASDTLGFEKLISTTLLNNKYKKKYSFSEPVLYDGPHYILYYKTTNQKEHFIDYIPRKLPHNLRLLHDFIVNIITAKNSLLTDPFEFNPITTTLAEKYYQMEKPLKSSIMFDPPEILPDTALPDSN